MAEVVILFMMEAPMLAVLSPQISETGHAD